MRNKLWQKTADESSSRTLSCLGRYESKRQVQLSKWKVFKGLFINQFLPGTRRIFS